MKFKSSLFKVIKSLSWSLAIVVVLISCSPTKGVNNYQLQELDFAIIEDMEFLIVKEKQSLISDCISASEEVIAEIRGINKDVKKVIRLVTKRGNLRKGLPSRCLKTKGYINFQYCINRAGYPVMARIIESSYNIKRSELKRLLSTVLDYEYEISKANCLVCGEVMFENSSVK